MHELHRGLRCGQRLPGIFSNAGWSGLGCAVSAGPDLAVGRPLGAGDRQSRQRRERPGARLLGRNSDSSPQTRSSFDGMTRTVRGAVLGEPVVVTQRRGAAGGVRNAHPRLHLILPRGMTARAIHGLQPETRATVERAQGDGGGRRFAISARFGTPSPETSSKPLVAVQQPTRLTSLLPETTS